MAKSPCGHYKSALGDPHGPITPAEPSACAALGTAAISFTSGTKNITTTCTGVHMPVTHVSYPTVFLASSPTTLRIPGGSTQVLVVRIGYNVIVIQYIP